MKARLLLVLVMMSGLTSVAAAQTTEEIIEKNVEARGGAEKFAAVHSMVVKTVEETNWGGRGSSMLTVMRPDKMRFYYEWRGVGPRAPHPTLVVAFDGDGGWLARDQKAPIKVTGDGIAELRWTARNQFVETLGDYKANGVTIELVGKEDVDGQQCYKLRFTHADAVQYAYYDAQSFLVIRYEVEGHRKKSEIPLDVAVSDYRSVDGILFPHSFTIAHSISPFALSRGLPQLFSFADKRSIMTSTVQSIEINPDIDENSFQMPGSEAAASAKR
jgi:hypothetical protein